jgi:hypothetical protein
MQPECRKKKH